MMGMGSRIWGSVEQDSWGWHREQTPLKGQAHRRLEGRGLVTHGPGQTHEDTLIVLFGSHVHILA
jgi:hypothetical protein